MSLTPGNGAHDPSIPVTRCDACALVERVARVERMARVSEADGGALLAGQRELQEAFRQALAGVRLELGELARTINAMVAVLDEVARKG